MTIIGTKLQIMKALTWTFILYYYFKLFVCEENVPVSSIYIYDTLSFIKQLQWLEQDLIESRKKHLIFISLVIRIVRFKMHDL